MPYLLKVSICSLLFFLPYFVLFKGKNSFAANRWYLILALLTSFIIPVMHISIWSERIIIPQQVNNIIASASPKTSETTGIAWMQWVSIIYLLGVFFHSLLLLLGLKKIFRMIQSGKKIRHDKHTQIITGNNHSISSFLGYLFIPNNRQSNITDYEIMHESCHIAQKHSLDILFIELVKIILWFNPIIILYKREITLIHEYLADQHCISLFGRSKYERFLVSQLSAIHKPVLVHTFNSLFKQRILMMNSSKSISKWKYATSIPLFIVCLFLFSFTTKKIYQYEKLGVGATQDTIIPEFLRTKSFSDTLVTIDSTTGEESVEIIARTFHYNGETNPQPYSKIAVDTVTTFDPETYKESVQIVHFAIEGKVNPNIENDTITIVNSLTGYRDTYIVPSDDQIGVNMTVASVDAIDTITTFDPYTYNESSISLNHVTGVVDTIYANRRPKKID